jgi:TRAP-type C4-dicarboxylate transport system permease small subunit
VAAAAAPGFAILVRHAHKNRRRSALRHRLLAIERRITALSLAFACVMMVVAACLGLYQILARFVFQQPAEWSEVLIRFSLIWMVFMGAPAAFRQGAMVCIDVAHRKSGPAVRRALEWITAVAALTLLGFMIWYGFDYSWRARVQTISGLESFSMTWAYLAIPIGAVLAIPGVIGCLVDPRRQELETAQ